jgi:c-di-GMP phosphodiesterase
MFQDNGIEIVKTIIQIAHNLKINIIAEGVEHREQAEHLHKLSREYAQRYYFSKPPSVETIEQSLLNNIVLKTA